MSDYVHSELTIGETFFVEILIRDEDNLPEDVSSVTKSVQCSTGLSEGDFTISNGSDTGYVEIKAADTSAWTAGIYTVQLWFDYGATADVRYEIQLEIKVTVREAI